MVDHLLTSLALIRLVSSIVAVALVVYAVRAWRKTDDDRMLRLTAGFTLLLVSLIIEGASFQLLIPGDLVVAHLLEAGTQLAAVLVLLWSVI